MLVWFVAVIVFVHGTAPYTRTAVLWSPVIRCSFAVSRLFAAFFFFVFVSRQHDIYNEIASLTTGAVSSFYPNLRERFNS